MGLAGHIPLWLHNRSKPTIDWSFLGSIPSALTFARASSGTYFDATGTLVSAADNAPRFDYDPVTHEAKGVLLESAATNYLTKSYLLSGWINNSSVSTTDNFYISPDGTQNATQIVVDAPNKGRYLQVNGLTAATDYAVSGFVKSYDGGTVIRVGMYTTEDVVGNGTININTSTGVIQSYGSKTYDRYSVLLPNGWTYYRYRVKTGVAQTALAYVAYSASAASTYSVWGAQLEAGTFASSYIPTTTAAATRAADSLSTTNISWFNPAQGAVVVQFIIPNQMSAAAQLADMGAYQFCNVQANLKVGTYSPAFYTANTYPLNTVGKAGFSYTTSSRALCLNGGTVASSITAPTFGTTLYLGHTSTVSQHLNGYLRSFKYWNRALGNIELQRITT